MWSRDGQTLYYREADGVKAARVRTSPTFEVLSRALRLPGEFTSGDRVTGYEVAEDGRDLIMLQRAGHQSRLVWVVNWHAELRERMATQQR